MQNTYIGNIKYRNKSSLKSQVPEDGRSKLYTYYFLPNKCMQIYFVPCKVIDTVASEIGIDFWIAK